MILITQFPPGDPIISAGLNMPSFTDIDNDGDEVICYNVLWSIWISVNQ